MLETFGIIPSCNAPLTGYPSLSAVPLAAPMIPRPGPSMTGPRWRPSPIHGLGPYLTAITTKFVDSSPVARSSPLDPVNSAFARARGQHATKLVPALLPRVRRRQQQKQATAGPSESMPFSRLAFLPCSHNQHRGTVDCATSQIRQCHIHHGMHETPPCSRHITSMTMYRRGFTESNKPDSAIVDQPAMVASPAMATRAAPATISVTTGAPPAESQSDAHHHGAGIHCYNEMDWR